MREIRVSDKYCPWINSTLKTLMKQRDGLKNKVIKSKSRIIMNAYRQARNKVNSLNTKLKREFFEGKILASKGNMKETWKTVNEAIGKRSKSTRIDSIKDSGGNIVNKEFIANQMNRFFCSIGKDLANDIEAAPNPLLNRLDRHFDINNKSHIFHFRTISIEEIREAVRNVKASKGFGIDHLSSYFIKQAIPYIENSLAFIFNTSIETSVFPDMWKIARITPIFKDGNKTNKSNYRPISVLPVLSRIFEKLVYNQLYKYLEENCFLSANQSGFRALHSTATCLLKNCEDWYDAMDNGEITGLVYVDLIKAFDTVDHSILCQKLEHYIVENRKLSWFKSYLNNRRQFCRVNGVDSKIETIEPGVPQGSCLGPLLFLLYINDLPQALSTSSVSMYADDTSLCSRSKDLKELNKA